MSAPLSGLLATMTHLEEQTGLQESENGKSYRKEIPVLKVTTSPADWPVIVKRIITQYFTRPNYTKIDGKPIFAMFSASLFIKSFQSPEEAIMAMDYFREETVKAGFP